MARYLGTKCRLCRRERAKLYLKGERCYSSHCPIERKGAVPPGQQGPKRQKKLSEYGQQLREKQKVKRIYGILERQFARYFAKATKSQKVRGTVLLQFLESRLDNVVYRLGLAPSRSVARQLVTHGQVLVNDKKINISSFQVKVGQVISLNPKGQAMAIIKKSLAEKERKIPPWLKRQGAVGKLIRLPQREEIDADINESLIVEYYSR